MVINLYSAFFIDIFKCALQASDQTSAYTGAVGSRYQSISDLTHHINEWNEAWPQHRELGPTLGDKCVGFFYVPQGCVNREGLWDGTYGLRSITHNIPDITSPLLAATSALLARISINAGLSALAFLFTARFASSYCRLYLSFSLSDIAYFFRALRFWMVSSTFSYVVLSIFAGLEISHWPMLFAVSTYVARYSPSLGYSPGALPWGG